MTDAKSRNEREIRRLIAKLANAVEEGIAFRAFDPMGGKAEMIASV